LFAKVSRGKDGMVDYELTGIRKDSKYLRNEKDKVVPLYGDIMINKQAEQYLVNNKNNAHNYLHISLSFTSEEFSRIKSMSRSKRTNMLRELVIIYIKHHTTGYHTEDEVIAYAEAHEPIIFEENGKERLFHIHLQIMNLNPISDTSLATTYAGTAYMDNVLETYINKKYNLVQPMTNKGDKTKADTLANEFRDILIDRTSQLSSIEELEAFLRESSVGYTKIGNDNTGYYLKLEEGFSIKGRGFEQLTTFVSQNEMEKNIHKTKEELEERLRTYYENRSTHVKKRKSKKTLQTLQNLEEKSKTLSKQNKILPWSIPDKYSLDDELLRYSDINEFSVHKNEEKQSIEFMDQEGNTVIECFKEDIVYNQSPDNQQDKWLKMLLEILKRKEIDLTKASVIGSLEFMQMLSLNTKLDVELIRQSQEKATIDRSLDILDMICQNIGDVKVKSKKRYGKLKKK